MNVQAIVLCVALGFVVMTTGQCERSPASYLEKPSWRRFEYQAYDWVKQTLEEQNLASREEMLLFFKKTSRDNPLPTGFSVKSYEINDIINHLIELADGDGHCRPDVVVHFIKIVENIYGNLEAMELPGAPANDSGLFDYLKFYGAQKFVACLHDLDCHRVFDVDLEKSLDELVASQDKEISKTSNDKYLASLATTIDLVEDKFDAKRMLNVAKDHGLSYKEGNAYTLTRFVTTKCSALLASMKDLVDIYSLSRLLDPTSVQGFPDKLVKVSEYVYFCNQYFNSYQKVRANIEHQVSRNLFKRAKVLLGWS